LDSHLPRFLYRKGVPVWRDVVVLKWVAQIVSAVLVIAFIYFLISNLLEAAEARGLGLGYGFLKTAAGFPMAESVIPYDPSRSFGYALWAGFLNTIKVSIVGIFLATILGLIAALARLSTNWLVRNIAGVYVNIIRNIPLLVQLFIWYFGIFQQLPGVNQALSLPGPVYLSQRGLYMVGMLPTGTFSEWLPFLLGGLVLSWLAYRLLLAYQVRSGRATYPALVGLILLIGLPSVGWLIASAPPLEKSVPVLGNFNFSGGCG